MNNKRVITVRETLLQRLAYILRPFVVYMLVKTVAMLTLEMLVMYFARAAGYVEWLSDSSNMVSAVINAAASIVGMCFVLNDFLKEAAVYGEVDIGSGVFGQLWKFLKSAFFGWRSLLLCAVLGVLSAFAFNFIIELVSSFMENILQTQGLLGSDKYESVRQIQYSVSLVLGLFLYGIVSPLVEEAVFRGIVYNRIKRFYSVKAAVIFSAHLFGVFHRNLPQFIYGTAMGILLAVCYERTKCFGAAVVFHAAANIAVFLASY